MPLLPKNPTNYNPYTNPENLIHRRNFIMYNMWQQGVISEEDYCNGAAQPFVLAEEDSGKKPSTVTSYFTDALFNEVVQDIMTKGGHQRVRGTEAALHRRLYHRSHCQHQAAVPDGKPDAEHRRCLLPGGLA